MKIYFRKIILVGFYERIIDIIKCCLKKVVALLNYDDLTTLLAKNKQTLNSRSMAYFCLICFMEETYQNET